MRKLGWVAILVLLSGGLAFAGIERAEDTVVYEPGVNGVIGPRLIQESKIAPEYPPAALAAGVENTVVLLATILPDGEVGPIRVIHDKQPRLGFYQAAESAIRDWDFEPATRDGEAVASYKVLRLNFFRQRVSGPSAAAHVDGTFLNLRASELFTGERFSTNSTDGGFSLAGTSDFQIKNYKLPREVVGEDGLYRRADLIPGRELRSDPRVGGPRK